MECRYHSVQTMGTLDGPGIRFVLFVQGCCLRCGYCHNPDTWDINGGKTASVDEIYQQISRCRSYFGKKGGVTVSGGEPLLQAEFVTELFKKCRENGINTCLDTSGCVWNKQVEQLLNYTDLCILDIKMTNNADYEKYIGCSIEKPLYFLEQLQEKNIKTWLREVIVSDVNDNEDSVKKFAKLGKNHSCVVFQELLPFHKICKSKYDEMKIQFPFDIYPPTSQEKIDNLSKYL